MQSDRKKITPHSTEVEVGALQGAHMERPQLAGPLNGPDQVAPVGPGQSPQEFLHTSFSFETPRAKIQEGAQRVTAERIRQIRSSIAVRSKQANNTRHRDSPENTKISLSHGETIIDRVMAWIALSLKSLELRLFSRPKASTPKNAPQPDREKERRERESKERQRLEHAMRARREKRGPGKLR